jgi:hypothetical protein
MLWLGRLLPAVAVASLARGGGSDGPSSPNPPPPGSLTVSGTVVDSCLQPVPDAVVWIRNRGVTRTDAGGIRNVMLPVPESAEVRTATALGDGRFTLP